MPNEPMRAWTAWVIGFTGLGSTWFVGTRLLGMSLSDSLICVLASVVAGMISLLATLQAERTPWIRRKILNRSLKTWALLATFYFGLLLALAPPLRDGIRFAGLVIPALLSTGFTVLAFGPIQDWLVARAQRQSR